MNGELTFDNSGKPMLVKQTNPSKFPERPSSKYAVKAVKPPKRPLHAPVKKIEIKTKATEMRQSDSRVGSRVNSARRLSEAGKNRRLSAHAHGETRPVTS
jgi:hypothetical protein